MIPTGASSKSGGSSSSGKGKNYSAAEVDKLLDLVEIALPTGIDEWNRE